MDTVIIKIHGPKKFKIKKLDWFMPELHSRKYENLSPAEKNLPANRHYLRRFILKPPYEQPFYIPQIEVFETLLRDKRQIKYVMKIQFSIPKLLYGNSLQEVAEKDSQRAYSTLQSCLEKLGINVEADAIVDSMVSAVHFCKNVPLPRDIRMQEIINELMLVDLGKAVDVTGRSYKQGGLTLNLYSGVIGRVFYDKISDSIRPKNKRTDKDPVDPEREIVERFGLESVEVFRYEYRIKSAQTVKREMNKVLERDDKTEFVVFRELFAEGLFKKMIVHSWLGLIQKPQNQLALLGPVDNLNVFSHILSKAKEQKANAHSMNKALTSYGLTRAIKEHGAKEVRRVIFTLWNSDHSERVTEKLKTASEFADGLGPSNCISFIDGKLDKFETITLDMLRNIV